jgi:hypothetical protein
VVDAFAALVDAPQLVIAAGIAAVEVGDAVGAAAGGRQSVCTSLFGPAGVRGRTDAQGAEFIERESAARALVDRVLDPLQLGIEVRIRGFLPGLRALEGPRRASKRRRVFRPIRTGREMLRRK